MIFHYVPIILLFKFENESVPILIIKALEHLPKHSPKYPCKNWTHVPNSPVEYPAAIVAPEVLYMVTIIRPHHRRHSAWKMAIAAVCVESSS